jgi:phosphinothricin acetyltransferase
MTKAPEDILIRDAAAQDAISIADIYNHYVATAIVTFEEEPVTSAEIVRRIAEVRSTSLPWLVAEHGGRVTGYAYATPWKNRAAYRFAVEITVYVAPGHVGRGIGSKLYECLLPMLRARGIHAGIGTVALPNEASVKLVEKFGFRKSGEFHEIGFKFGRWIDVGYWQLTL